MVFEQNIVNEADDLYQEEGREAARDLCRRIRVACKKYWLAQGRQLPEGLLFEDPDEQPPARIMRAKK